MYAVVVTVDMGDAPAEESQKHLHEFVVPAAKSAEGFVRGIWLRARDASNGRGVMVFDTEEKAAAAAALAEQGPPPGAPVSTRSVEIFEVMAEA